MMNQFPAFGLGKPAGIQSQTETVQLCLADMTLNSEQKFVIEIPRVVDAVGVADQRIEQRTQLQHLLPVGTIPRQPRYLVPHHDADLAQANGRDQSLKAGADRRLLTGLPLVVVNNDDLALFPAQLQHPLALSSLIETTLAILQDLLGIGLADVDDRLPLQMGRLNFSGTVHSPPPP